MVLSEGLRHSLGEGFLERSLNWYPVESYPLLSLEKLSDDELANLCSETKPNKKNINKKSLSKEI